MQFSVLPSRRANLVLVIVSWSEAEAYQSVLSRDGDPNLHFYFRKTTSHRSTKGRLDGEFLEAKKKISPLLKYLQQDRIKVS